MALAGYYSGTLAIDSCLPFEHAAFVEKTYFLPLAPALLIGNVSTIFTPLICFAYLRCENSQRQ
jgi:hypothetical protein